MKNIIIFGILLLVSIGLVSAYNGDFCNSTHSPCGGGVIVPQSIIPVKTVSSAESTSFFGNFINSIIDWFKGLFVVVVGVYTFVNILGGKN